MQANTRQPFDDLKCCVIIPTYNNEKTLQHVIEGVLSYTSNLIVVNDGSTDSTSEILSKFPDIPVQHISPNRGKGNALKTGFRFAVQHGYEYAITIDSDGQHMPSDLPKFLDKIEAEPGSLIIGARNMNQDGVPGKSSFGNRFSNFWYKVETGYDMPDTQSGYRLYPIKRLNKLKYFTRKFEFEIEVIVRAAWRGIPVTSIPIEVFYAEGDDRVTHFRPFKDFTRISVLNTVLVFLAFAIYRPLMYFRSFTLKKFFGTGESTFKLASAVGFGAFMGIVPLWGMQMISAAFIAHFLRLNKALVLIASNISFGPMVAVIIYLSFLLGGVFMENPVKLSFDNSLGLHSIKLSLMQYITGSMVLASGIGLLMFLFAYSTISIKRNTKLTTKNR